MKQDVRGRLERKLVRSAVKLGSDWHRNSIAHIEILSKPANLDDPLSTNMFREVFMGSIRIYDRIFAGD